MNVARVCKVVPSAQPHEFLGYHKNSLEGMLLTIALLSKLSAEEAEANATAQHGQSTGAAGRLAKHMRNK